MNGLPLWRGTKAALEMPMNKGKSAMDIAFIFMMISVEKQVNDSGTRRVNFLKTKD
jgi:hypothetical protein